MYVYACVVPDRWKYCRAVVQGTTPAYLRASAIDIPSIKTELKPVSAYYLMVSAWSLERFSLVRFIRLGSDVHSADREREQAADNS